MHRLLGASCVLIAMMTAALAASGRQPAPPGAFDGAPPQYTQFSAAELSRGFLALAFGSDLRIGARPTGIRRFDHPITAHVTGGGTVDRRAAMSRVNGDYARAVPGLHLSETSAEAADIELRLIDEKDFQSALQAAFGARVARTFVTRTDPQCMTSVKSTADGTIVHSISFIIVDKGDDVFLDCAYHELLHAFGLSNHDQRNAWTTLNQKRMVGYLTAYDRALLTLLYDPQISPGMTIRQAHKVLPELIDERGLAAAPKDR
jgi:opacity protein-like surface antigen